MRTARNRGTLTRETMERLLLCRPHCPFCWTAPFRGQASTVLRPANAEVKIPEDFYCTKWSAGEGRTSLHFRGREPEHAFPAAHSGIEADRQAAGGIVCIPENRRGSQKEKEINSSTLGFVRQFTGSPYTFGTAYFVVTTYRKAMQNPPPATFGRYRKQVAEIPFQLIRHTYAQATGLQTCH